MAKAGFTHEMWVARRAGTNAQVAQYIACRDGVSVSQAKKTGRSDGNFDTFTPNKSGKSIRRRGAPRTPSTTTFRCSADHSVMHDIASKRKWPGQARP